jgi:glycosyltransferase involved in cell wall biosynthesis
VKVLHVIPSLAARTGGPAVSVVEASLALRELDVESSVFATDMGTPASAPHRRADAGALPPGAHALDVRLFESRAPRRFAFSTELGRALTREIGAYDVVHIHSLFLFPQFAAYRNARAHGVPYVVSPRGSLDPYLRTKGRTRKALVHLLWQRAMLASAHGLHLTSVGEAELVVDVAPSVPRHVVPNGIDWNAFQALPNATAFRARRLGGHEGPLVLYLGRISFKKGLDTLIESLADLGSAHADAALAIVGPDDEGLTPALRKLAAARGIANRVHFTGMAHGEERLAALAAADVWALPSRTENFAVALVEALASGRAVVTTNAVNLSPQLEAEGAALICRPNRVELAQALDALLRDETLRVELGTKGREHARRYDWAQVAPQHAAMYEAVASC